MELQVEKRDGRIVNFDPQFIENAIGKAYRAIGRKDDYLAHDITEQVMQEAFAHFNDRIAIYEIQAIVEQTLLNNGEYDVAEAYIDYRKKRDIERARAMDVNVGVEKLLARDRSIVDENANKDGRVFHTLRDFTAGTTAKAVGLKMLPPHVSNAHLKGDIHFHDLDYMPYAPYTNCCLPDFTSMLRDGYQMGGAQIESPNSIGTAVAQVAQIIASVSSSQYGGVTVDSIDELLAPYAHKNYLKHLADAKRWIEDPSKHKEYATEKTRKDIYDAMQALEYEVNTLQTSNGQSPFTSVGFGLGSVEYPELARMIQAAILEVRRKGLGKLARTAVFPKLIFALKDGINLNPEDPNYDIKQLAIACATERMYPDVVSYDKITEITGNFKYPMGCVAGWETVQMDNSYTTIENMWEDMAEFHVVETQPDGVNEYIDLHNVFISDSHTGTAQQVACHRIIRNKASRWLQIKVNGGRVLTCTPDHPLPVEGRGRVEASKLNIGDKLSFANFAKQDQPNESPVYGSKAWLMGLILCDGCLSGYSEAIVSYAYSGESEIRSRIAEWYDDSEIRDWEHHRGKKGDYREFAIKDASLVSRCISDFSGVIKNDRSVPEKIFHAPRRERVEFLAGMIDADGYINQRSQNVQIGSINPAIAYGQLRLAETLGLEAKVYLNRYNAKDPSKIRFRIEFPISTEIADALVCEKKRAQIRNINRNPRNETGQVTSIKVIDGPEYSYDVTTETDYFDVSGLVSHNCRSYLQAWWDEDGYPVNQGRMNLGVVTLNLPRIALEARGDFERFWNILDDRLEIVKDALLYRLERVKEAQVENAPIMYQHGAFGKRLNPGDEVDEVFKNNRATISLGYIGLYEVATAFYGPNWEDNPEAKQFTLDVLRTLAEYAKELKAEHGYHFSVYATPSESLTDRFCRLDRAKFGDIEDITDKGYYTNSFHYDVRKSPNPFEKLDFEADYPQYSGGGFIHYCEYPVLKQNPEALEAVWDYAYNKVGYLGTNTPIDRCYKCGFTGDFQATDDSFVCPQCGNDDPESCDVVKRVCGYLSQPQLRPVIKGRQQEIVARQKHMASPTALDQRRV